MLGKNWARRTGGPDGARHTSDRLLVMGLQEHQGAQRASASKASTPLQAGPLAYPTGPTRFEGYDPFPSQLAHSKHAHTPKRPQWVPMSSRTLGLAEPSGSAAHQVIPFACGEQALQAHNPAGPGSGEAGSPLSLGACLHMRARLATVRACSCTTLHTRALLP